MVEISGVIINAIRYLFHIIPDHFRPERQRMKARDIREEVEQKLEETPLPSEKARLVENCLQM